MNGKLLAAGATFVGLVALANWASETLGMVALGWGLSVSAGTFAAGATLVARDAVYETAGGSDRRSRALLVVGLLIVMGAALSLGLAVPMLALASGVAFLVAESFDAVAYVAAEHWGKPAAVAISGAVGAPVDTLVFLWLSPFAVTWGAVTGQVVIKLGLSLLAALLLAALLRRRNAEAVPA